MPNWRLAVPSVMTFSFSVDTPYSVGGYRLKKCPRSLNHYIEPIDYEDGGS
jgi:hypothetical protein